MSYWLSHTSPGPSTSPRQMEQTLWSLVGSSPPILFSCDHAGWSCLLRPFAIRASEFSPTWLPLSKTIILHMALSQAV